MASKGSVTIRKSSDITIVNVNEDLGGHVASDFRQTLEELTGQQARKIIVNLGRVQHINSTAVGAIVGAARRLRQKGGDVKICALADNLKRVFDLIGASGVIDIYESESSTAAAF